MARVRCFTLSCVLLLGGGQAWAQAVAAQAAIAQAAGRAGGVVGSAAGIAPLLPPHSSALSLTSPSPSIFASPSLASSLIPTIGNGPGFIVPAPLSVQPVAAPISAPVLRISAAPSRVLPGERQGAERGRRVSAGKLASLVHGITRTPDSIFRRLAGFWDGKKIAGSLSVETGAGSDTAGRSERPWNPPSVTPAPSHLEDLHRLKVGTYNTMHVLQHPGRYVWDAAQGRLVKVGEGLKKSLEHRQQTAEVIRESDLDVVVLQEVESREHLARFNEEFLEGAYDIFHLEGNDPVGINSAILVKKGLPVDFEYRSHKGETWHNPAYGRVKKLFTRDLTALIVREKETGRPLFVLVAAHMKSKHSGKNSPEHELDPENAVQRKAQADRMADIIGKLQKELGDRVPVLLAGDFNGRLEEPAFEAFFERTGMRDSFDLTPEPMDPKDRITHTFHPHDGPARFQQLDAILVSPSIRGVIQGASVYRYHDYDGRVRPLPKTFDERAKNPSDHFPALVTLDFPKMRRGAGSEISGREALSRNPGSVVAGARRIP